MKKYSDDYISVFKYEFTEKFTLFFSVGFLIINLLIFALVMSESLVISLVLAATFLIYLPIGYYDKQEEIWIICSRVLEVITSISVSLAYILLFGEFWLLFLPILEISGGILFYIFVYRNVFPKEEKSYSRYSRRY